MTTATIYNDAVTAIQIGGNNFANTIVTIPPGTIFTPTSGTPASLAVAMRGPDASGRFYVDCTPLVQQSPGIPVSVSAPGLPTITMTVTITPDPATVAYVYFIVPGSVKSAQPVPTAPGP